MLSFTQVISQEITLSMIAEQEKLCQADYLVNRIDENIHKLDTLSLQEIKSIYEESYHYYTNNKEKIIMNYNQWFIKEDSLFNSLKKRYKTEDEKTNTKEDTYLNLINDNHLMYRDTLQNGVYFEQIFKNNTHSIKMIGRNNGSTVYNFSSDKTISPFYFLNFDSEFQAYIKNIYYHDSEENNMPIKLDNYGIQLNPISIPQMKHIDSVDMQITVKYLTKIDTLRFNVNEIGVEKKGFSLLKMEDNYLEYSAPYNYRGYHKGTVLEEEFYNEKGEILEDKYGITNITMENSEDAYLKRLEHFEKSHLLIKGLKKREDIYNALKYIELLRTNKYLQSNTKQRQVVEGNVKSLKLYIENQRDSLSFDMRIRNISPVKNMYIHRFNNKTEFIDKNGKILLQIPYYISFLYDSYNSFYSENYFFTTDKDDTKTFYFLDKINKVKVKLPYKEIGFLCPTLLYAIDTNNEIQLIDTEKYEVLVDKKFINFEKYHYIEKSIQIHTQDNSYYLFDQNNQLIKPKTSTPITKVTLKKIE